MTLIDARGMCCPWPAVRLARALREGATEVDIVADDANAPAELAATAAVLGATLVEIGGPGAPAFRVRAAGINAPFTQAG